MNLDSHTPIKEPTPQRRERRELILFLVGSLVAFALYGGANLCLSQTILKHFAPFDYHAVEYLNRHSTQPGIEGLAEDVLTLGDSTASRNLLGVAWPGLRVLSLNVLGGSLVDGAFLLRRYLKNNPPPDCVLISTSYGAIDSHEKEFFWTSLNEYGLYQPDEMAEFYEISRSQGEFPGAVLSPFVFWKNIFFTYNSRWIEFGILQRGIWSREPAVKATRAARFLERHRGAVPSSRAASIRDAVNFFGENTRFLQSDFKVHKTLDLYIRDLLQNLENAQVNSIFLIPPMAESGRSPVAERWVSDYQVHLAKILSEFPRAKGLLDMTWLPDREFVDLNHLVDTSAQIYSQNLRPEIEACRTKAANRSSRP